jgi:hypothetical protein
MGKTRYTRAKEFLEKLKQNEGNLLDFSSLRRKIFILIGSDEERTVKPYLKLMLDTGLISEEGDNVRIN